MPVPVQTALLFLINTIFDLYLFVLIIRLILVWVRSDYFNPLVQLVVKLTNFIVKPVRNVLPNIQHLETASLFLVIVLELLKFSLITLLSVGMPNLVGLILLACGDVFKLIIETFFYAILLGVILSWVQPGAPLDRIIYQFTSPIMRPLRLIPPIGGIDITPIPALIILQLLTILLVNPLMTAGWKMALS